MGGYSYDLKLTKSKPEKAVVAAGIELWEWFRGELAVRVTDPLGKQLLEYVDMYTPSAVGPNDYSEWPTVRSEGGALCIIVGDAGGVAYNSCLASIHALTLFADRDPAAVDAVLKRHGLSRSAAQPMDTTIRESRFFLFRGGVAMIDDESGDDDLVSHDGSAEDEGGELPLDELSPAEQKQVRGFIQRAVCECPACSVPRVIAKRGKTTKLVAKKATTRKPGRTPLPPKRTPR